jgi:polar amino acid transport system substrate-binding protein
VLSVPKNLCVHLPENVSFESGAYGTLGAIALQGVRLAEPTLGESVVVIGLGLVGQLTVQLLKANGCRVFGLDLDQSRVSLALELGADKAIVSNDEAANEIDAWTRGYGADAVLITAATDSNQPIELAASVSRLKGRVIVVGMTGMDIPRAPFFSRELKLIISMSYGPGRYDPEYEERGQDYPLPYVRWTEKRNIESFLELIGDGRVNVERLTTHRFPIAEADRAYQLISGDLQEANLGVVLSYDPEAPVLRKISLGAATPVRKSEKSVVLGVIGAGGYVPPMLLPHFKSEGVEFRSVATASGISAHDVGKKFGFAYAVSSVDEVLDDANINLVVIGTRHDTHAELARAALERNKHVFVEKPLALNDQQLGSVLEAVAGSPAKLMVGYNRRFSPLAQRAKEYFSNSEAPLSILYRVNAGRLPKEHWAQNAEEGGGRIVGEVCHFIDLMQYLTGALPASVFAESITSKSGKIVDADSIFITLRFADGSNGTVAYLSEGDRALAKERVEIYGGGRVFVLDDFRRATLYKDGREEQVTLKTQDKGQQAQVRAVCTSVLEGGPALISIDDLAATSRATFRVLDSLRERHPFEI